MAITAPVTLSGVTNVTGSLAVYIATNGDLICKDSPFTTTVDANGDTDSITITDVISGLSYKQTMTYTNGAVSSTGWVKQ